MSEEQKQPEIAGSPAAPAEDLQVPTEPDSVTGEAVSERGASSRQVGAAAQPTLGTLEAPSETAKGAIAQAAETGPAPSDVPVTNDRELEAWNEQVRRRMRQKSRRSFLGWGVGVVASLGAFRWLTTRREIDGVPWPFRKTLEVNEELARDYFSPERLSPTFAPDRVSADRVNGDLGLDEDVDVAVWKLRVEGLASEDGPLILGLNAIRQLPRLEMIAQFKCIEGWSVVVRWAGTRFSDFMKAYLPRTRSGGPFSLKNPEDLPPYVSMTTPDGGYYVGLEYGEHAASTDAALLRAQRRTPLPGTRRAPAAGDPGEVWREEIKRIGTIRYCTQRPADYWAGEVMTGTSDFSCNNPNHTKEQQSMTRRIAILVMAMGMSLGLANRVTTIALARPQDDKMHSDDKMKDDKMAGDKMAGDKMSKKSKKHKKDKMADDKMEDDKMKDDKMKEQKN